MAKRKRMWVFLLCIFGLLFFFVCKADAIVKIGETFSIGGYLENETAISTVDGNDYIDAKGRTKHAKSGDLVRCRHTLQLETLWRPTDYFKLGGIFRGFYDSSFDWDASIEQYPENKKSVFGRDDMEGGVELRELHATFSLGNMTIKAGRQQIIWGESDLLRMADVINPLDLSWSWLFKSWEEIRIPLEMIDVKYDFGGEHNFAMEIVYNPGDYEPSRFAAPGAHWALPLTNNILGDQAVYDWMRHDIPDRKGSQGGMRLRGVFGEWDVHIYDYYQRVQGMNPVSTFDPGRLASTGFPMRFHYPFINTLGATFNVYEKGTQTVFRGECGYVFDEPFTADNPNPFLAALGLPGRDYKEKDTFSFMLGFDRPTFIPWLNSDKTFFISGQIFNKFILNCDGGDNLHTGLGQDGRARHMTVATLLINTEYMDAKLKPEITAGYDINGKGFVLWPSIKYEPNYWIGFTLGAHIMWGWGENPYGAGSFAPMRKMDEIYTNVRFKF